MIITISGLPGSGKTSVAKAVAKRLGYRHYSIGDMRGKMAMERGISIDELNKLGEKESWTDREVDEFQRKLGEKEDNFVTDGRTGFHFIPHSRKVFLKVDLKVGAERIFRDQRPDEPGYRSAGEVVKELRKRMESDRKRYGKWYGIDCWDEKNYDIVIDTTKLTKEQVVEKVLGFLGKKS